MILRPTGAWSVVNGLFCVGGPVAECSFALVDGTFGASGLVLVGFGDSSRSVDLVNRAGFVVLDLGHTPANTATRATEPEPRGGAT